MFVLSYHTTRSRLAVVIGVAVCLVILLLLWIGDAASPTSASFPVGDTARRIAYLGELGYEADPESERVEEMTLPEEFDARMTAYNELQIAAGMDLSPYRGQRLKCWTYTVTNYPGEQPVTACLYVHDGSVVGGDISATGDKGFQTGLEALTQEQNDGG